MGLICPILPPAPQPQDSVKSLALPAVLLLESPALSFAKHPRSQLASCWPQGYLPAAYAFATTNRPKGIP